MAAPPYDARPYEFQVSPKSYNRPQLFLYAVPNNVRVRMMEHLKEFIIFSKICEVSLIHLSMNLKVADVATNRKITDKCNSSASSSVYIPDLETSIDKIVGVVPF